jgi:hypothetical protein
MPTCELGTALVPCSVWCLCVWSHVQVKSVDCFRLILRYNLNCAKCMLCGKSVVMCLVKVTGHCEVCLHFLYVLSHISHELFVEFWSSRTVTTPCQWQVVWICAEDNKGRPHLRFHVPCHMCLLNDLCDCNFLELYLCCTTRKSFGFLL